jgi:hypothetical protein
LEEGPLVEHRKQQANADWDRLTSIMHTPEGPLESSTLISRSGLPSMVETYYIKSPADAKAYLSLPLPRLCGDGESFFAMVRQLGDRGIVEALIQTNPAGLVAEMTGSELFAMMTVTDRDLVHELCRRNMQVLLRRIEHINALGLGPYFCMQGEELIVPPLHGPADFDDFNVRYDKPLIDAIHNAGGRIHIHCHGRIGKVFKGFVEMGVDVLHPFEPPPMGDITAAQAKQQARGRMCLEGNIQIADMYEKTPDEIHSRTEQLIAETFDDHQGLIVCPTASAYQYGKGHQTMPQFKAMVETVLNWKP